MNIKKTSEILFSKEPVRVEFTALSELKDLAQAAAGASMRAGDGLNNVIKGLAEAKKIANSGQAQARKASAVAKDLGIDTAEFDKFDQMFGRWYDDYENSIKIVQNLQNRL